MALNLKAIQGGGKKFVEQENIVPGVYPGRIVQIIDLGLQPQKPFQNQEKAPAPELMVTYELVDEFMRDENGEEIKDKPRWISETFPLRNIDQDKAKSTIRYLALDPKMEFDGDFTKLLNIPCNVTIVNNKSGDKVYDNVAAVGAMRPRDAANCPELVNPTKLFDLDAPDVDVFNALPKWVRDKIQGNLNYNGSALAKKLGGKQEKPAEQEEVQDNNNPY